MQPPKMPLTTSALLFALILLIFCDCHFKNTPVSKNEFAKMYSSALKKKYPAVVFIVGEDNSINWKYGDKEFKSFTDNAYIEYAAEPDSIQAVLLKYLRISEELLNDKREVEKNSIVPLIKPIEYLNDVDLSAYPGKKLSIVYEKYNSELIIAYAENTESLLYILADDDFKKLKISKDSLLPISVRNLDKTLPEIKTQGDGGLFMVTAGGNFEASLILLPYIWTKENLHVDGDFVIAIPNRDMLLVTGSNDKKNVAKLKDMAEKLYKTGDHQVSEYLYKWNKGKFERFE